VWRYKPTVRSVQKSPEFQEYFVHYPLKESECSSHYYFQKLAGRDQDVLDVGCGQGFMASKIAAQQNRVVGIDVLTRPEKEEAFTQYISADLSEGLAEATRALGGEATRALGSRKFDKILLMDVLEHLVKPEKLLQDCHNLLKPAGQVLVSVPNVANLTGAAGASVR
jgi:2-polyprenyl-3-methyl-5-hydroxy-6-metoxy-1,4-benzoquinol methylase